MNKTRQERVRRIMVTISLVVLLATAPGCAIPLLIPVVMGAGAAVAVTTSEQDVLGELTSVKELDEKGEVVVTRDRVAGSSKDSPEKKEEPAAPAAKQQTKEDAKKETGKESTSK